METLVIGLFLGFALAYLMLRRQKDQSHNALKSLDNFKGESDAWEGTFWEANRITTCVGRSDGQFRQAERQIYLEVCQAISQDSRLTREIIDRLIDHLDGLSVTAFKQAVTRLTKQSAETQSLVIDAAQRMIATQKTVHAVEQEAIDYMRQRLAMNSVR